MTTSSRRLNPAQLLAQGGPAATRRVREAERTSREGSLNPRHSANLTYHKATRSFTPEPEISFGRDPLDVFDVQPKSATRRSGSSASSDLPELHSEIQKLLRGVLTQINPATPSMNSGSYSSNMGLKRLKEKLESLDRLNRMLEERSQALAEAEAQLEARLSDVTQRQRDSCSGSPRTRALEAELSETKALLAMYRQESASPDSVRRRLTFDSIQSSERDARTAVYSGNAGAEDSGVDKGAEGSGDASKTFIESRELDDRFLSILAEEEAISENRGALEAKDSELRRDTEALEARQKEFEAFVARETKAAVASDLIADLIQHAMVTVAQRTADTATDRREEIQTLAFQLQEDLNTARICKENLQTQIRGVTQLNTELQNQRKALIDAQTKLSEELSLIREGKADALIKKRDELLHRKEAAFNEKLARLQEREARVRAKEQELALQEAKLLSGDVRPASPIAVCESPTPSVDKDSRLMSLQKRERDLKALKSALKSRTKLLEEQEDALKKTTAALELQQAKVKRAWEAAQLKIDQAKNLELRLDTIKAEIAAKQSELERKKAEMETKPTEGKTNSELQRLRAELRCRIEEVHAAVSKRTEAEARTVQLEAVLAEKDRDIAALKSRVSDLRKSQQKSSKRQLDDGLNQSPTSSDFAQVFRARQQTMLQTLDAADREKREMSQTLHEFLSDLH